MSELWVLDATWDDIDDWDLLDEKKGLMQAQLPPDWTVRVFSSTIDAFNAEGRPDALVVDIGTICGPYPQPEHGMRVAEELLRKYPGATLFVCSAVGGWAEDAVADIADRADAAPVWIDSDIWTWEKTFHEYGIFTKENTCSE